MFFSIDSDPFVWVHFNTKYIFLDEIKSVDIDKVRIWILKIVHILNDPDNILDSGFVPDFSFQSLYFGLSFFQTGARYKVLEKVGFMKEGTLRRSFFIRGE